MEQESKSMEIQRYAFRDAEGAYVRYADHAAAMKAAQDAIAVEKRALLKANAELAKDTERVRVMREALEKIVTIGTAHLLREIPLDIAYAHADRTARAALASTAPVADCVNKISDLTVRTNPAKEEQ